jgi:hypothetical protein
MKITDHLSASYQREHPLYWTSLSRTTNLLIILNLSLFFVTELVTRHGYYYTYYSLFCLGIVHLGLLLPLGLLSRLWYYCLFLIIEAVAIYYFVVSVWYWVVTTKGQGI